MRLASECSGPARRLAPPPAARRGDGPAAAIRSVFVVDDDAEVRRAMSLLLSAAGYRVRDFASGSAFLVEMVGREDAGCACAVLDIHLPGGLDGIQVADALRSSHARIVPVLVTGRRDDAVLRRARQAGLGPVLEKPLQRGALLQAVRRALGSDDAKD